MNHILFSANHTATLQTEQISTLVFYWRIHKVLIWRNVNQHSRRSLHILHLKHQHGIHCITTIRSCDNLWEATTDPQEVLQTFIRIKKSTIYLYQGYTTFFSLLPTALRLFLWITATSEFKILFALFLFCFHTLCQSCFHAFVWTSFYWVTYPHAQQRKSLY